jgi:hypothetical protein
VDFFRVQGMALPYAPQLLLVESGVLEGAFWLACAGPAVGCAGITGAADVNL